MDHIEYDFLLATCNKRVSILHFLPDVRRIDRQNLSTDAGPAPAEE